jgi:uncharacterized protein DUF4282
MPGYFSFQRFVTSYFIKVIYFIGFMALTAGGTGLAGWAAMRLYEASIPRELGWYYVASGVGILLLGNLIWRVFCELWVVLFNINDRLVSLDRKFGGATITAEVIHDDATKERTHEDAAPRGTDALARPAGVLGLSG